MARTSAMFLLGLAFLLSRTESLSQMCRGPRCLPSRGRSAVRGPTDPHAAASGPGRQLRLSPQPGQGQAHPSDRWQDANIHHQHRGSAPLTGPHAARTITAEVFHPGCTAGTCATAHRATHDAGECSGTGCSPDPRLRQKPKSCVGCDTHKGDDAERNGDREAEFSEGGARLELTCRMKSGSNVVPSDDAIVLRLQLYEDQDKLAEALKGQQEEVKVMHRLLSEQQGELLQQQKEILTQQKRMQDYVEQVKAQYSVLLDTIKQASMQNLQEDLDGHRQVLSEPRRFQQAVPLGKVDMEARVMEVGRSLADCGSCGPDEYCDFAGAQPRCDKCTVCPAGFFLVSQCSLHADRICQDRDECLELADLCQDQHKCVNTPGGFRCHGMTEREARSGMCGHEHFYNFDMDECQACAECEGQPATSACTFATDTVCAGPATADGALSLSWTGAVSLPGARGHLVNLASPGAKLHIGAGGDTGLASAEDGHLLLKKHGLLWLDENLAVDHGCRSFVQACLRTSVPDGSESRDLSGVRLEQREAKSLQGVSLSGVAEVAPGHVISASLWSVNHCNRSNEGLRLHESSAASLSLLWLSHDTGAVAVTAQAALSAHYHTNHRPSFRITSTSDAYVVVPTHDGRGIRFAESGSVRFVFQQALYSVGQACVTEGFQMLAYLNRNGTAAELCRSFKPGVHYRDTSISLSGTADVASGDTLAFEILSPAQCNIRFFSDNTGVSGLSLVWVPAAVSSSMHASVAQTGLPSGAIRNKPLFFSRTGTQVSQMGLGGQGAANSSRDFVFRESGTASVALDLKLIHSCSLVKVTLLRLNNLRTPGGTLPVQLAQQVGGQMPDGTQWASVSLRASFRVENGTAVFFALDCVRGRVNQVSHHAGSGVSLLWVAA
ncbi:uncharacterized protein si:ch211-252f13.5 [Syngnathoides biaculeatus]|uniref:uncharacterized protein si:ch211-252f13.5 n=1 Tax=Syngnathoides biaculeatus TaxID=300417 RepID=UPI002ADE8542|nr:uncharacterized protein si:ch211-252f13.5 [Syngnathoides biaculeatus]